MSLFSQLLTAAMFSLMIQNVVFSSGFAMSEAIRLAKMPKYYFTYSATIVYYTFTTSLVCGILDKIPFFAKLSSMKHYLLFAAVLTVIYILSSVFMIVVLKANRGLMNSFGMCAINSLVLAVPIMNSHSATGIFPSLGTGIGAGIAFFFAVTLINSGMRRIFQNKDIPKAFRGMPAVFIYVALISLALTCLSGNETTILW